MTFEEFLLKRQANTTNCFLFETCDPKRISQFKQFILQAQRQPSITIFVG